MKHQYRQRATFMFAGITAIGLFALVSLIIINPSGTVTTKASRNRTPLTSLTPMIHSCRFAYRDCNNQVNTTETEEPVSIIARNFDINPKVLLTLAHLAGNEAADQTALTRIAQQLKLIYKNTDHNSLMATFSHPLFGTYRLENIDLTNYILISYLSQNVSSKAQFENALATPDKSDGQVIGFQETYTSLFNQNPLQP